MKRLIFYHTAHCGENGVFSGLTIWLLWSNMAAAQQWSYCRCYLLLPLFGDRLSGEGMT